MTKKKDIPKGILAKTAEQLRILLELKRSSSSSKHRNKKKYYRPEEKRISDE